MKEAWSRGMQDIRADPGARQPEPSALLAFFTGRPARLRRLEPLRALAAALLATTLFAAPVSGAAAREGGFEPARSLSGNFLAGYIAGLARDPSAAAVFLREALIDDPANPELMERGFVAFLADGSMEDAFELGERLLALDPDNGLAQLALGVGELSRSRWSAAVDRFADGATGRAADLTATLLAAWAQAGARDATAALETIDRLSGEPAFEIFRLYHGGLVSAYLGLNEEADTRLAAAHAAQPGALAIVDAYGRHLARSGRVAEAIAVYETFLQQVPRHPLAADRLARLHAADPGALTRPLEEFVEAEVGVGDSIWGYWTSGGRLAGTGLTWEAFRAAIEERNREILADGRLSPGEIVILPVAPGQVAPVLPAPVRSAAEGAAEALYALGSAGNMQGDEMPAIIYLRLALHLAPDHGMALITLADVFERMNHREQAIALYDRVDRASPLHVTAEIEASHALERLERTAEAESRLRRLMAERPNDFEVVTALANILRVRKSWTDAANYYTRAIELVGEPDASHWTLFYFRGASYERAKQWPKAEADLKRALELVPANLPVGRAQVLNYLGYSWVDMGINIDDAFEMLQEAVSLSPRDGMIIDSLGWGYYRLGRYEDAVRELERAVELEPGDPVINDHLGDAYWKVGRRIEARFQWRHALDNDPEPDDRVKIERKLEVGLEEDDPEAPASAGTPATAPNGG